MQYNQRDQLTMGELHSAIGTKFPRDQLVGVLQSLVKTDLLKLTDAQGQPMRELDPQTATDQHQLRLNTGFQK